VNTTKARQHFKALICAIISIVILLSFNACSKDTPDNLFLFYASLSGSQALPPNAEISTGSCNVTYDSVSNEITYTIRWKDLTAVPISINFQEPAPGVPGFTNIAIPSFPSKTSASTSGHVTIDQEHEADLLKDNFYLNISTSTHTEGEIRGRLEK